MQGMNLGLLIITNQSGVGRGYFDVNRLEEIHDQLLSLLKKNGITIDGVYYCPHKPDDKCGCRKPETGLVKEAGKKLHFNTNGNFVIGDKASDIMLGKNIQATTFLVQTGYGTFTEKMTGINPDFIVNDLLEAAEIIRFEIEQSR